LKPLTSNPQKGVSEHELDRPLSLNQVSENSKVIPISLLASPATMKMTSEVLSPPIDAEISKNKTDLQTDPPQPTVNENKNLSQSPLETHSAPHPQKELSMHSGLERSLSSNQATAMIKADVSPIGAEILGKKTDEIKRANGLRPNLSQISQGEEILGSSSSALQTSLHSIVGTTLGDSGNGKKRPPESADVTNSPQPPPYDSREKGTTDMKMIVDEKTIIPKNTTQNTSISYNLRQNPQRMAKKPTVITRKSKKKEPE